MASNRRVVVVWFGFVFGGFAGFFGVSTFIVRVMERYIENYFFVYDAKNMHIHERQQQPNARLKLLNYAALPRHSDAGTSETSAECVYECVCVY